MAFIYYSFMFDCVCTSVKMFRVIVACIALFLLLVIFNGSRVVYTVNFSLYYFLLISYVILSFC